MNTDTILHILNRQKARYPVKPSATGEDLNDMNREALDCAIKIIKSYAELPNNPLTLDELEKMDGEPVWTVTIGIPDSGRWELCKYHMIKACPLHAVIRCFTMVDENITDYELNTYGKTWLAYRRKPERVEK